MIFNRMIAKCFSLALSFDHAMVTAITLAVPLLPSYVKWFLHIPWLINRNAIWREFALGKALLINASCFFTVFYASPASEYKIEWITEIMKELLSMNINKGERDFRNKQSQKLIHLTSMHKNALKETLGAQKLATALIRLNTKSMEH